MAKGNPNSAAVQYKVLVKPTDIGLLVIKRIERPHVDKSAELRRFIELGYAAEQAGFILDGTILRHAGRMWDTQPSLNVQVQTPVSQTGANQAAEPQHAPARRSAKSEPESAQAISGPQDPVPLTESADNAPPSTSSLRGKLRGLSG